MLHQLQCSLSLDPTQVQQETKERNPVPSGARHAGYNPRGPCSVLAPGGEAWFGEKSTVFVQITDYWADVLLSGQNERLQELHTWSQTSCTGYKIIPLGEIQEWIRWSKETGKKSLCSRLQQICRCTCDSFYPQIMFYVLLDIQITFKLMQAIFYWGIIYIIITSSLVCPDLRVFLRLRSKYVLDGQTLAKLCSLQLP